VSIEKLPVSFINEFNSALKYGVNNIQQAVNDDFKSTSLSKKDTFNYLTKRINYNLTADKRKGLQLFLEFIKRL
jgi:chorismate dehydratase